MSDDSNPRSPIVDYLTREADQKMVHRAFESLEKSLSQIAESGEQEQLQMLRDRLDQVDSRLDDFNERLMALEDAVSKQNDLLSQLIGVQEGREELSRVAPSDESKPNGTCSDDISSNPDTSPHDDWPESIVDEGAMILEEDTSAHYVLHLEIEGRTLEINVELDEGSGRVKVKPELVLRKFQHRVRIQNGRLQFESVYPPLKHKRVAYEFESKSCTVSIGDSFFTDEKSYRLVSAEPK